MGAKNVPGSDIFHEVVGNPNTHIEAGTRWTRARNQDRYSKVPTFREMSLCVCTTDCAGSPDAYQ